MQDRGDIGRQAEDEAPFHHHQQIEQLAPRIAEDRAVVPERAGEAERRPGGVRPRFQHQHDEERGDRGERAGDAEHGAPADMVGDQPGERRSGHLPDDHDDEEAPEHDLALGHRCAIPDRGHGERE